MNIRKDSRFVTCAVVAMTCASFARADTLLVPSEYATIQAAIDAASDGDEVVIADGAYIGEGNRDVSFLGKAITVRSASGDPESCIIDCEEAARGFLLNSGESLDSVLSGLTILRGRDLELTKDDCPVYGGGVLINKSSATISNCSFIDCRLDPFICDLGFGGAIAVENGAVVIDGCRFVDCRAYGNCSAYGGAISIRDSQVEIIASLFEDNAVVGGGCAGNGPGRGGAIYCGGSSAESQVSIQRCQFLSNSAGGVSGHGGAIYVEQGATVDLVNSLLVDNRGGAGGEFGGSSGAGVFDLGVLSVANCTVAGNYFSDTSVSATGGISVSTTGTATVTNSIVYGNDLEQIAAAGGGSVVVSFSDVEGGFPGEGNLDLDPLFLNPFLGMYQPVCGSPVIDAGDNAAVAEGITTDISGSPRFVDDPYTSDTGSGRTPIVDMGAFELQASDCNRNSILDVCEIQEGQSMTVTSDRASPIIDDKDQTLVFTELPLATADVIIEVEAVADLGFASEYIDILIEGMLVGEVFRDSGFADCIAGVSHDFIVVDEDLFNSLMGDDGEVSIVLAPSSAVHACEGSYAIVTLRGWSLYDTDGDGVLDECQCPADLDASGDVGFSDLLLLLNAWNSDNADADLDDSGSVGFADLLLLLDAWGPCA